MHPALRWYNGLEWEEWPLNDPHRRPFSPGEEEIYERVCCVARDCLLDAVEDHDMDKEQLQTDDEEYVLKLVGTDMHIGISKDYRRFFMIWDDDNAVLDSLCHDLTLLFALCLPDRIRLTFDDQMSGERSEMNERSFDFEQMRQNPQRIPVRTCWVFPEQALASQEALDDFLQIITGPA